MELQQMENQYRIQEALTKERLAQLERQYLYNAKKHELLRQQEEEDERRSVRSSDSRASTSRVEKWVKSQTETGNTGPGVNKKTTESDDHVQPLIGNKAESLHVKFTSTPLASPNASFNESSYVSLTVSGLVPSSPEDLNEKESYSEVPKVPDLKPAENKSIEVPEPPVTMESILKLLQISLEKPQKTGAVPKILKVHPSTFEEWRSIIQRKSLDSIPEVLEAKKNEQLMRVVLQQLEDRRAEEQQLQRQREEQPKRKLQQQEREQAKQKMELQRQFSWRK